MSMLMIVLLFPAVYLLGHYKGYDLGYKDGSYEREK